MMKDSSQSKANAIILAAGRSLRTAPYSFEVPKALFKVHGEILIERLIRQLNEVGVTDITVVVGHLKEKFLYLEEEFGVNLEINKDFDTKSNTWSLWLAKDKLANTYVCNCDCYFVNNPFLDASEDSYHAALKVNNYTPSLCCETQGPIGKVYRGADHGAYLAGFAHFSPSFSRAYLAVLEREINLYRTRQLFWEELIELCPEQMSLRYFSHDTLFEFNSLDELQKFDSNFLDSVDSCIFKTICSVLGGSVDSIKNIKPINGGLTNVSFTFEKDGQTYVYRHPGATSQSFINRKAELIAQTKAKELGIDTTFIAMSEAQGWKISHFMEGCLPFTYSNKSAFKAVLKKLKRLHQEPVPSEMPRLNTFQEAERLLGIVKSKNSSTITNDIELLRSQIARLYHATELDGYALALCHNDTYSVNFLENARELNIIDWEYAGAGDPVNDIGSIVCRHPFTETEVDEMIEMYYEEDLNDKTYRHAIAGIAISGWYWFCWSLCKDSVGDDFGFYYLDAYRTARRYAQKAFALYGMEA